MPNNKPKIDASKVSPNKALRRRRYYSGPTAKRMAALWLMLNIPGLRVHPLANLGSIQSVTRLRVAEAVT